MTGTRAPDEAPGTPRDGMPRLTALHRGDFWSGQRIAACGQSLRARAGSPLPPSSRERDES